jgi:hypothetical protein
MVRISISLSVSEADALAKLAYSKFRDPPDQIRLWIRRELEEAKLLEPMSIDGIEYRSSTKRKR